MWQRASGGTGKLITTVVYSGHDRMCKRPYTDKEEKEEEEEEEEEKKKRKKKALEF